VQREPREAGGFDKPLFNLFGSGQKALKVRPPKPGAEELPPPLPPVDKPPEIELPPPPPEPGLRLPSLPLIPRRGR
jgi:hypothetical protein